MKLLIVAFVLTMFSVACVAPTETMVQRIVAEELAQLELPAGPQGVPGVMGPPGVQGIAGETGPRGLPGARGPQGEKGDTGEIGPAGVQGVPGSQGIAGPVGPRGPAGPRGYKGETGTFDGSGIENLGVEGLLVSDVIAGKINVSELRVSSLVVTDQSGKEIAQLSPGPGIPLFALYGWPGVVNTAVIMTPLRNVNGAALTFSNGNRMCLTDQYVAPCFVDNQSNFVRWK